MSTFQADDLAYAIFRHKGKIIALTIIGLVSGTLTWFLSKRQYASEAMLMIRYVVESRSSGSMNSVDQVVTPENRASGIANSEIELLRSGDLAREVVAAVGATNVLKSAGGDASDQQATAIVREGLDLGVIPKTSIIQVTFRHSDPLIAREVVRTLIERYLRLHARVHGSIDQLEDLRRQYDIKRKLVEDREASLQSKEVDLNLTLPLNEARRTLAALEATLEMQVLTIEASLAEARSPFQDSTNSPPVIEKKAELGLVTNLPIVTIGETDQNVVNNYRALNVRLEAIERRQQDLLLTFSPNSSFLRPIAAQLANVIRDRNALVADHPGLNYLPKVVDPKLADASSALIASAELATRDRAASLARISASEAKLAKVNEQLDGIKIRARLLASKESTVAKAQRELEQANKEFNYFSTAIERAIADEAVASSSRLANISVIESASAAYLTTGKILKVSSLIAGAGPAAGLCLAFLLEHFADTSVRRRKQIINKLGLPLFLMVPRLKRLNINGKNPSVLTDSNSARQMSTTEFTGYADALRDRLIKYFEQRDLSHKPKLIGVTSCEHSSGVTTVATALAASLSETGEGKVLYVDVNSATGPSVHPFQQGKAVARIQDIFENGSRDSALVQPHLYAVSLGEQKNGHFGVIPKTISDLVPKIKASDYDYIIFDLPPVSQTSMTARVAGLLDVNVVVLESEKTLLGRAEQSVRLLVENKSDVVTVLNKHRRFLPAKFDADI